MAVPDPARTIVVTACDEAHASLAADLLASIRAARRQHFALGLVWLGRDAIPASLDAPDVHRPVREPVVPSRPFEGYILAARNVKPSLPILFPGFETYIWIDADCWVQNEDWYDALVDGAERADLCAHPEYDVHYLIHPTPNDRTIALYRNLYEPAAAEAVLRYPMVNAGVFAARGGSKLWAAWSGVLDLLRERHERDAHRRIFFCDQVPLHHLIHTRQLTLAPLRAIYNWQTYACLPGIDLARKRLTVPTPPFEEMSLLHLAGDMKTARFPLPDGAGGTTLRYGDIRRLFGI